MAAITDHLKSASAEIAKAADVVRQEIDQLRTKDIDLKNMLEKQAVDLAAKANQHEQEAARSDDDNHKSTVLNIARDLRTQIPKVRQQQREEQKRITDLIRDKQSQFESLSTQSRNIVPS